MLLQDCALLWILAPGIRQMPHKWKGTKLKESHICWLSADKSIQTSVTQVQQLFFQRLFIKKKTIYTEMESKALTENTMRSCARNKTTVQHNKKSKTIQLHLIWLSPQAAIVFCLQQYNNFQAANNTFSNTSQRIHGITSLICLEKEQLLVFWENFLMQNMMNWKQLFVTSGSASCLSSFQITHKPDAFSNRLLFLRHLGHWYSLEHVISFPIRQITRKCISIRVFSLKLIFLHEIKQILKKRIEQKWDV